MSFHLKRVKRARLLVALTAAVIPLLVPVAAHAAMGGAQPAVSTDKPVLLSATVVTPNKVRFCFDKEIKDTSLTFSDFRVGGYRSNREVGSASVSRNIDLPDLKCLDATYSNTAIDTSYPNTRPTTSQGSETGSGPRGLENFTYGRVLQDGVQSQRGNVGSIGDSTALTGSSTHNGTRGLSAGPDLIGVALDRTANALLFVFDEKVKTADCTMFHYYRPNGDRINGQSINENPTVCAVSDNVVQVPFLQADGAVNDATRVYIQQGAVTARTGRDGTSNAFDGQTPNLIQSAVIPGKDGRTSRPDLISAVISPSGNSITYQFDEPLAQAPGEASDFKMGLSNGAWESGTGMSVTTNVGSCTGCAVIVTFDGTGVNEYAVIGSVNQDGIQGTNGSLDNTAGGVPIGDNAGAFASGFTTGAEALRTTFNASTGEVDVLLDQRITGLNTGRFHLLAADGSDLGVTPSGGAPNAGTAQQVTLQLFFSPAVTQVARSLYIDRFAMETNLGDSAENVEQATSPFTTAAVLRKGSRAVWHKASRRAHRAAVRRFRARALARSHSKK